MTKAEGRVALYADGGVIGANPSSVGGTWAYCLVDAAGHRVLHDSGVVLPTAEMPQVTNNITEMLAILYGLDQLPADWHGTVYSDSMVALGRIFEGWRCSNVPPFVQDHLYRAWHRMDAFMRIRHVLLDGHPTRDQLARGVGKRGGPVSEHNVYCDQLCRDGAKRYGVPAQKDG
jgi:ribonuclease HI